MHRSKNTTTHTKAHYNQIAPSPKKNFGQKPEKKWSKDNCDHILLKRNRQAKKQGNNIIVLKRKKTENVEFLSNKNTLNKLRQNNNFIFRKAKAE